MVNNDLIKDTTRLVPGPVPLRLPPVAPGGHTASFDFAESELLVSMPACLLAEAGQGEQKHRRSSNSACPWIAAGGATWQAKASQGCPERVTLARRK